MMKKSKLGLGLAVGAAVGAAAGLFLAPKKGKELRKDVAEGVEKVRDMLTEKNPKEVIRDIFGSVTDQTEETFEKSKTLLAQKIAPLTSRVSKLDRSKYETLVVDVIQQLKKDKEVVGTAQEKLKKYLLADYKKLTRTTKNPVKKKSIKKTRNST